jgi:cold shock CspA family protein
MDLTDVAHGPAADGTVVGVVEAFDEAGGYGTVVADGPDGRPGGRWFFHCTPIPDGTRTIDSGTPVTFEVVPGRMGRYEAVHLVRAPADPGGR